MKDITINYCPKCGNNTLKDGICRNYRCNYSLKLTATMLKWQTVRR